MSGINLIASAENGNAVEIVKDNVQIVIAQSALETLHVVEESKVEVTIVTQDKELSAQTVERLEQIDPINSELAKTVYTIGIKHNDEEIAKAEQLFEVAIDISDLELSDGQRKNFTAIYFDSKAETYMQLGGEFSDNGGVFSFNSPYSGDHGLIVSDNLTKVKLQIGNGSYMLNGEAQDTDAAPFINENGRTELPLRVIAESLGAEVDWEQDTSTVIIRKDGITVELPLNMPLPDNLGMARIVGDRTFVPVRYVADQLGANVVWDAKEKLVNIYK